MFAFAVLLFFCLSLVVTFVFLRRTRLRTRVDGMEPILARLAVLDRAKVAQVAADLTSPITRDHPGPELEGWQVWELIGGLEGLETMAANCDVLIDLACYVQQWYPEALPVAEQLRLNAREIQWHVERLRGAERRGNLQTAFPDYAQRAAAIYYGMTQHVLALFEISEVPGLTALQAAL